MTFVVDTNAETGAQIPVPKRPISEHRFNDELIKQIYNLIVRSVVFKSSVANTPYNVSSLNNFGNY
ncbi:hypothetical protein BPOR_0301g00020 [Botrytis porri]|uniref:Uncharacterized protein n=1 Tax=Botrytis porri TaxID=87229 RepID=A0A4Z1KLU3_9HELO|nr:hypothetical protein BPOR_0301g00020 [Botrytis porri]